MSQSCWHRGTIDVFFFQTEGKKRWLLYPPVVELPLKQQKLTIDQTKLGEPIFDQILEPGDMLYVPRGLIHGGVTLGEHSLHITVALTPFRIVDRLQDVLTRMALSNVALRKTMLDSKRACDLAQSLAEMLSNVLPTIASEPLPNRGSNSEGLRFLATRPLVAPHVFQNCNRLEPLSLGTLVERNLLATLFFETNLPEGLLTIYLPPIGSTKQSVSPQPSMRAPYFVADALAFINTQSQAFRISALPSNLTDSAKLILIKSLVDAGLLVVVDSSAEA